MSGHDHFGGIYSEPRRIMWQPSAPPA